MYKYIKDGCEIIWEPNDKNLGIEIVREVTGKTSSQENLVEVNEIQREKITRLYEERNHDPVEDQEEASGVTVEKVEKDLEEFKIQSALAQAEIFEKLENDKLTIMSALAETYEANLGGK